MSDDIILNPAHSVDSRLDAYMVQPLRKCCGSSIFNLLSRRLVQISCSSPEINFLDLPDKPIRTYIKKHSQTKLGGWVVKTALTSPSSTYNIPHSSIRT